jgi:transcriptional regulator GlxA family with amidase domain
MKRKLHCVAVAVDGGIGSAVYGPIELLYACKQMQSGLPELEPCEISFEILSYDGSPFQSAAGYRHPVDSGLKELPADTVILVPGFGLPVADRIPGLLELHAALGAWLERQHANGCQIVGWCTGNFLLAEWGLLPGRKATTYWVYGDLFRARYPHIELDVDATLVEDERVFCVGGPACGVDAALAVIERFIGKDVARLCMKLMMLENRRPSELRYEQRQAVTHNDPLVESAVNWIRGNLHTRLTVDQLLRQVPTSRRNLTRRFKTETGESLQSFIQRLRVDRAKLLLETSSLQIEKIVDQIGYNNPSAFSRLFKQHTRLTPNQYRQRFGLT